LIKIAALIVLFCTATELLMTVISVLFCDGKWSDSLHATAHLLLTIALTIATVLFMEALP
jgi:hypothetical protein